MSVVSDKIQRGRGLNKHYWSPEQDHALIESLSILHMDPKWRADIGFQSGYLHAMEKMMNDRLPGCGLKASPHIESRVKTLKAKFNALHDMLSLSGFGWNSESMMIECEKSVFDDYVKKRCKDAAGLYGKPFPYYYALLEIYGKDRATGAFVGSAADDEEEIRLEDLNVNSAFSDVGVDFGTNQGNDMNMGFDATNLSFSFGNTSQIFEDNGNSPEISVPKRNAKARRLDETNKTFKMMARSIADIGPKIDGLIDVLGHEKEIFDLQSRLKGELRKFPNFNSRPIFKATKKLATDHDLLRVFFTCGDDEKEDFIMQLLDDDNN